MWWVRVALCLIRLCNCWGVCTSIVEHVHELLRGHNIGKDLTSQKRFCSTGMTQQAQPAPEVSLTSLQVPTVFRETKRNVAKPTTKHLVYTLHAARVDREMPPTQEIYRYTNYLCPGPSEVLVFLHKKLPLLVMQNPHNTGSHITAQSAVLHHQHIVWQFQLSLDHATASVHAPAGRKAICTKRAGPLLHYLVCGLGVLLQADAALLAAMRLMRGVNLPGHQALSAAGRGTGSLKLMEGKPAAPQPSHPCCLARLWACG